MTVAATDQFFEYPARVLARVRKSDRWARTAWHEAGHAVALLSFNIPVTLVALTPFDRSDRGVCQCNLSPGDEWGFGVSLMAGAWAEQLITDGPVAAGKDRARAVDLAERLAGVVTGEPGLDRRPAPGRIVRRFRGEAKDIVRAFRSAVGRAAVGLLDSPALALGGAEVARLARISGV